MTGKGGPANRNRVCRWTFHLAEVKLHREKVLRPRRGYVLPAEPSLLGEILLRAFISGGG